jgi:hypothetical protein
VADLEEAMNVITMGDYWMGRDREYPTAMSPDLEARARLTVELVGRLLMKAGDAGIRIPVNQRTGSRLTSGWRPPTVNASTPGAAPNSKHMTGQAADVFDPDGDLDEWLMTDAGQQAMLQLGLWMEHPSATKGWSHLQTVPPRSGKRVFYP